MKTKRGSWILACLCSAMLLACGGDDSSPGGSAGSSGSGGAGGSGATGGSAGSGGSSGAAGSAGSGGSAGGDAGSDVAPCAATDIRGKLLCIPGLTIATDTTSGAFRRFTMTLDQPVDHTNPSGQKFKQRLTLLHRDEGAPVVLASSGYNISSGGGEVTELGTLFATNVIQVEHRYFPPSIPDPVDWKYLNIKQSAGDYHDITVAMKSIYKGKWINTGASKGGMTSIYFRRFYPNDLDATLAYVAPNSFGLDDQRYPEFIRKVGGDTYAACRASLVELQKTVLMRRAEMTQRMTSGTATYNSLGGADIALEHATLEMPFTFWQYRNPTSATNGCSAIPAADAPIATLYPFFNTAAALSNFSDTGFEGFAAYYYQATNQLGAPGVDDSALVGLLAHRDTYRPAYYIPKGVEVPPWDAEAMVDVQNWVKTEGKTLMFVYGEYDPWSAGRYEIGASGDNHVYVAPAANHSANVNRLSATDKAEALMLLQNWLGVPPVMTLVPEGESHHPFDDETYRPRL
ncbi:MAG: S28 family serine protease [Polyangiaceae bacterium]